MAYQYIVVPDTTEGVDVKNGNVFFANNQDQIESCIREMSLIHPTVTICVYRLDQLAKLKSKPVYARYKSQENGELLPV